MVRATSFSGTWFCVILALAGCGKAAKEREQTPPAEAGAVPAAAALPNGVAPDAGPPPDPAQDSRPDRTKIDDVSKRLQALQDQLAASDSQLITSVRGSFQRGAQAEVRTAILTYSSAIQGQAAATPAPPKVTACYARAADSLGAARDALAAEQQMHHQQAQAILGVSYRPISLADFAPLVGETTADPKAQAVAAALAQAQAKAAACGAAAAHTNRAGGPPGSQRRAAAYSPSGTSQPQSQAEAGSASATASAPPSPGVSPAGPAAPPKHRGGLLERLFGGGKHEP